jgi:hypothetical protein
LYGQSKQRVIQCHIDHPDWTANEIARHLSMSPATVRGIVNKLHVHLTTEWERREKEPRIKWDRRYRIPYAGKPSGGEQW